MIYIIIVLIYLLIAFYTRELILENVIYCENAIKTKTYNENILKKLILRGYIIDTISVLLGIGTIMLLISLVYNFMLYIIFALNISLLFLLLLSTKLKLR